MRLKFILGTSSKIYQSNGGIGILKKKLAVLLFIAVLFIPLGFQSRANASENFWISSSSLLMKAGENAALTSYNGSLEAIDVIWSSNNDAVAKVDGNGKVTAVNWGQAVITASSPNGDKATCAVNVAIKGVDVSKWQGSVDWSQVKSAGYDFAMIRSSLGNESWSTQTDPYFETNYTNAVENGLKVGVYHYSYATNASEASQEADFCLHVINGRHLDYPVAYDIEDKTQFGLSSETFGEMVQAFCSKIQAAGYKTVVYSYPKFYNAHLTSPLVSQYDTWIASTGGLTSPAFGGSFVMWQYAVTSVSGVSGNCDVDYSYVDYSNSETNNGTPENGTTPDTPNTPSTVDPLLFKCDTTSTYTFGANKVYYYKITTPDTMVPSCSSSNTSAVSVSYYSKTTDGFLFKLTSNGTGTATITTTAADGRNVSFTAVGASGTNASPSTPIPVSPSVPSTPTNSNLTCDTATPYTFGSNSVYCYKITTSGSTQPTAVSSNTSAVTVTFYKKISGGYLYKITNVGKGTAVITTTDSDGRKASFTAYGTAGGVVSDTPANITVKKGSTYQFKFTAKSGLSVSFTSGNGSVIKPASIKKIGNDYYYKILGVNKGCTGVYAKVSGQSSVRECIVTVA